PAGSARATQPQAAARRQRATGRSGRNVPPRSRATAVVVARPKRDVGSPVIAGTRCRDRQPVLARRGRAGRDLPTVPRRPAAGAADESEHGRDHRDRAPYRALRRMTGGQPPPTAALHAITARLRSSIPKSGDGSRQAVLRRRPAASSSSADEGTARGAATGALRKPRLTHSAKSSNAM